MGRIVSVLLGLLVVMGVAYYALYRRAPGGTERQGPAEQLEGARRAAKQIEQDQQKRAEESLKRSTGE